MRFLDVGFINKYPYTDFHELNIDALLRIVKEMVETMKDFISLNTIKYADPFDWSIVRQYETNTVVVDPLTGDAYISVQPVPQGVDISRTEYWSVIFNYNDQLKKKATFYATVADMIADQSLKPGYLAITAGYYNPGDNGGAVYYIDNSITNFGVILDNGYAAELGSVYDTRNMGKTSGENIDDILALNVPVKLMDDLTISATFNGDNIDFNGHSITSTSGSASTRCMFSKSKDGVRLFELGVGVKDANSANFTNIRVSKTTTSGGLFDIVTSSSITISDFDLHGEYDPGVVTNTDGFHITGGCSGITICNGILNTGDDAVALIAEDVDHSSDGIITDVTISNVIFGGACKNGVKIMNQTQEVHRVLIDGCIIHSSLSSNISIVAMDNSLPVTGPVDGIVIQNTQLINHNPDTSGYNHYCIKVRYPVTDMTVNNCIARQDYNASFMMLLSSIETLMINNITAHNYNVGAVAGTKNITIFNLYGTATANLNINNVVFASPDPTFFVRLAVVHTAKTCCFTNIFNKASTQDPVIELNDCEYLIAKNVLSGYTNVLAYLYSTGLTTVDIEDSTTSSRNVAAGTGTLRSIRGGILWSNPDVIKQGDSWYNTATNYLCFATADNAATHFTIT